MARSMAAIDDEIDRAAAVVLSLSTASAVPSPTRFPKETAAPSTGGSISRSSSALSSTRRSVKDFSICDGESMARLPPPQIRREQNQHQDGVRLTHRRLSGCRPESELVGVPAPVE